MSEETRDDEAGEYERREGERRDSTRFGRRHTDRVDAKAEVIWMERHFHEVISNEFLGLKRDLVGAVRETLALSLANVFERLERVEGRETRMVVAAALAASIVNFILFWVGKMAGWWHP